MRRYTEMKQIRKMKILKWFFNRKTKLESNMTYSAFFMKAANFSARQGKLVYIHKDYHEHIQRADAIDPDKLPGSKQMSRLPSEKEVEQSPGKRKLQEDYQTRFFTRVDFTDRKPLYITASTHRKLMRIVHLLDDSKATMSSYVENILLDHLEMFHAEINTIYKKNNINPTAE